MSKEAQFWELVAAAKNAEDQESAFWANDPPDVVDPPDLLTQALAAVVRFVERHPDHRDTFVRCFIELALWQQPAPWDLVPFCMRQLRFPEVQAAIHSDADAHWNPITEARFEHRTLRCEPGSASTESHTLESWLAEKQIVATDEDYCEARYYADHMNYWSAINAAYVEETAQ